jgi:hypothetical protein
MMKLAKSFLYSTLIAGAVLATTSSAFAAPNVGPSQPGVQSETASGDRWAVVDRNAVLFRFKGVINVTRGDTAVGSYIVRFNKDVTFCFYNATIGLPGTVGVESPGFITVVRRFNDRRAVYIETRSTTGALADRGFHLYVGCN